MVDDASTSTGQCRRVIGITFSLLAGLSWAVAGLFVKYVQDAGADEIQFVRSTLQYLVVLPLLTYGKQRLYFDEWKTNVCILLRGLFGVLGNWTFNTALLLTPLGDVISAVKTDVALTGLFACICLKERCTILEAVITLLAFVGLMFVARPSVIFGYQAAASPTTTSIAGVFLGLVSAVLTALSAVILRKLGFGVHYTVTMFHYAWIGVAFSLVVTASGGYARIPCTHDLIMASCAGLVGIFGQICWTLALQHEKAAYVAVLQSTQIIFALLLQFAFLGYVPPVTSLVGSTIIFFCSVALAAIRIRGGEFAEAKSELQTST